MKYGQVRERNDKQKIETGGKVHVVEAPCIMGNQKKIGFRMNRRKSLHQLQKNIEGRPKTTNTVIRSRTSEPRIREKLQQFERYDDGEENLRPTLSIRRYA